jgi:hypothetical protein
VGRRTLERRLDGTILSIRRLRNLPVPFHWGSLGSVRAAKHVSCSSRHGDRSHLAEGEPCPIATAYKPDNLGETERLSHELRNTPTNFVVISNYDTFMETLVSGKRTLDIAHEFL